MKQIALISAFVLAVLFFGRSPVSAATVRCQYDSNIEQWRIVGSCPSGTNYDPNACPANYGTDKDIPCVGGPTPTPATDCTSISGGHCVMQSQGCNTSEMGKTTQECGNLGGTVSWMCCVPRTPGVTPCPGGYCNLTTPAPVGGGGTSTNPFCSDGTSINTAIGCIPTDPAALFTKFFQFGIGIAGGIAFLLILFGGFQILTSAGNPEQMNEGKELVTSAIAGLLLIIFSVFLLRVIGVTILGIPGFG